MMSEVYYYKNEFTEIIAIRTNHEKYVNYVYLYIDKQTKQAFIVDPAWDVKKIETFIKNVAPQFVLLTHSHEIIQIWLITLHISMISQCIFQKKKEIIILLTVPI